MEFTLHQAGGLGIWWSCVQIPLGCWINTRWGWLPVIVPRLAKWVPTCWYPVSEWWPVQDCAQQQWRLLRQHQRSVQSMVPMDGWYWVYHCLCVKEIDWYWEMLLCWRTRSCRMHLHCGTLACLSLWHKTYTMHFPSGMGCLTLDFGFKLQTYAYSTLQCTITVIWPPSAA